MDFLGEEIPEYAILSHTWGEEIILQDLGVRAGEDSWKRKKFFQKVSNFCSPASENGYEWCWMETRYIEKISSAKESEAINSMFRLYPQSPVCWIYLKDMRVELSELEKLDMFENSRWYTRGWMLQEFLAPERVEFYDLDWNQFGTRLSLRDSIYNPTGIREEILTGKSDVKASQRNNCVAEKTSISNWSCQATFLYFRVGR